MSPISWIMPVVVFVALLVLLPGLGGVTGFAAFVLSASLAVSAWVVGRTARAVAGYYLETGNSCAGIFPTLLITFGGGFLTPLLVIWGLAAAVPGAAGVGVFAGVIAAAVCFGGFALRMIVSAFAGDSPSGSNR